VQPQIANPIYVEQGTDEWHELRLGRATASRFADIMTEGRNGYELAAKRNYRYELVAERLTGQRVDFFKSAAMQWGNDYEPTARLKYELRSGSEVEECGFFAHETLQAGASPDGLVGDDGILEIKCPLTATHIETLRKQKIPSLYYWQVMGQLWMTGREWCDFVSFDPRLPDNAQYFCTRVLRDEEAIRKLEMEVTSFLESVESEIAFVTNYKDGQ
jgi:putative phage-type endonuclease